jgi:dUTPase
MLMPKEKKKIDLHVRAKIPPGHFGLLKLRSSVSLDHDIQICGGIIGTY